MFWNGRGDIETFQKKNITHITAARTPEQYGRTITQWRIQFKCLSAEYIRRFTTEPQPPPPSSAFHLTMVWVSTAPTYTLPSPFLILGRRRRRRRRRVGAAGGVSVEKLGRRRPINQSVANAFADKMYAIPGRRRRYSRASLSSRLLLSCRGGGRRKDNGTIETKRPTALRYNIDVRLTSFLFWKTIGNRIIFITRNDITPTMYILCTYVHIVYTHIYMYMCMCGAHLPRGPKWNTRRMKW